MRNINHVHSSILQVYYKYLQVIISGLSIIYDNNTSKSNYGEQISIALYGDLR